MSFPSNSLHSFHAASPPYLQPLQRQTISHPNSNLAISLIHNLILRCELHADTVDTMSLICRSGISFSLEDVAQMSTTVRAHNFCSFHTECSVSVSGYCARDVIEVCRPSAARLELVGSFVKRGIAGGAGIDASIGHVLVVYTGSGSFGALLSEDAELLCQSCQLE
jgi:hypothetical protein